LGNASTYLSGNPMNTKLRFVCFADHSIKANARVVLPLLALPHIGIIPVPMDFSDGSNSKD